MYFALKAKKEKASPLIVVELRVCYDLKPSEGEPIWEWCGEMRFYGPEWEKFKTAVKADFVSITEDFEK